MSGGPPHATSDVTLVLSDLGSGGAQRVALTLAAHWADAGRRVTLVTLAGPERDFFPIPAGARRIVAGGMANSSSVLCGLVANIRRIVALRRALRSAAAPVAIAFIGPTAVLAVLAAIGTGIRVVAAERNDPSRQSFGRVWDALRRLAYKNAALVTANTAAALTSLSAFVPASRLVLTPNPLPRAVSGPAAALDEPTILSVARLHRQKGLDVLLEAVADAGAALADWRIVLLGEGPEGANLAAQAQRLGIGGRLSLGGVTDPRPWMRVATIFALPSRFEGTPNALLEAMAYGRPVVVSDASPGPLQWVRHGETGLVVPVENVAALAAALVRLADDPALRQRLGDAAAAALAMASSGDNAIAAWETALGWRS